MMISLNAHLEINMQMRTACHSGLSASSFVISRLRDRGCVSRQIYMSGNCDFKHELQCSVVVKWDRLIR
jgi:hypothetical protein